MIISHKLPFNTSQQSYYYTFSYLLTLSYFNSSDFLHPSPIFTLILLIGSLKKVETRTSIHSTQIFPLFLPTCTHLPVSLPMSCLGTYAELISPLIHKISSSCLLKDLTPAFLLFFLLQNCCFSVYKIIPISIKHALNIFNFKKKNSPHLESVLYICTL